MGAFRDNDKDWNRYPNNMRSGSTGSDNSAPENDNAGTSKGNGGKGFGWNWLVIDGIRVKDNSPFMYSIMNRSEKRDENIVYPWMSVCDCIVERTGDLPE